ncbi:MAG TPA: sigma-54-dependent Fis family transcriptional regulator [Macromonas sp.]|nr:sigma-54-dependent Fis family transcriptional regulator [Macromonas sp.]
MRTSTPGTAVRQARWQWLEHGQNPTGTVNELVLRSWQRSAAAGLLPTGRLGPPDNLAQQGLSLLRTRHQELLAHSRPVMEYLFEQVRHSQNVVVLAAPCGTLVHTQGDPYFLGKAERVALSSGASWHEDERGTNAIGTALAELRPVEIHGAEHYLERNGFLTCAAVPIQSGTGQLLGILDISGEHGSHSPHTLGLVGTAARMIENRLLIAHSQRHIRLHLHRHPEGIGTVAEGIVNVSEDGWIVSANRSGLQLLGLQAAQLGATPFERLLSHRLDDLLSRQRRRPGQPLPLQLTDGTVLYGQLHQDPATVRTLHPVAPTQAPHADALARLDSGDARWRNAATKTRRILDKPIPLLIQGESGVGKEWFARAAHDSGPRRNGPFVAVNCAALPEHLIESELFGYTPGAFTGARREGRPGLLREAHGGTLFLDEIGDMPLALQTRLLRVLQERRVTPLGGGPAVAVDFALVCATHRQLSDEVEQGRFRSDLYYRLNGLTVELPPLRERTDFDTLTEQLLAELEPQRDVALAPGLLAELRQHHWPGNLRQYASVLRTGCAMLEPHEHSIERQHLADDILRELQRGQRHQTARAPDHPPQNLDELSRQAVQQALESCRGNISQAARLLGISRQTLYRKLAR